MPDVTRNVTLNGVTPFTLMGQSYSWNGGFLGSVDVSWSEGTPTTQLNLTLSGSNWRVENMRFSGLGLDVALTDANANGGRVIHNLTLADGSSTLSLQNTQVRHIYANGDGPATITLGSQNTRLIYVFDGDTDVTGGSGNLEMFRTGGGNNSFLGGSGFVGAIRFGNGNDSVTLTENGADSISMGAGNSFVRTGLSFVGSITAYSNAADVNTFIIGAGGLRSLGVSNGRDTVTVLSGAFVEQMQLGNNDDRLTLRAESRVEAVQLGSGNNIAAIGAGNVGSLLAFGGIDQITLGTGSVDQMALGGGNNSLTIGTGYVRAVQTQNGNDTVALNGGRISTLDLGGGTNRVTLASGAQVHTLIAENGDDTIRLNGDARILTIKVDGGHNRLTTDRGNVESYYSYEGSNTLNIGSGGIQQVVLSGSGGTHVVRVEGFLGALQVYDAAVSTTLTTGSGGAISAFTGRGNDQITTGTGSVGLLAAGQGHDSVTVGSGGIAYITLGDGDDQLHLGSLTGQSDMSIDGGAGLDHVIFTGNARGVSIDLGAEVQRPGTGLGRLVLTTVEQVTGTAFADVLTGNAGANRLIGGAGADRLAGGAGADRLTGGSGSDVFLFNTTPGAANIDQITDFSVLEDTIRLENSVFSVLAPGMLGAAAFTANGTGLATAAGHRIIYQTTTGALFYDSDGSGGAARVQFATLEAGLGLTQADFVVI